MDKPVTPRGVNHLVLNVRDIEESHKFWTEVVGLEMVGQLTPTETRPNPPKMRFYSGKREDGSHHHHDIALLENKALPEPPKEWPMFGMPCAINHIAITMPSREKWMEHLAYLQKKGVKFVYDLPKEVWKDDIQGALNYVKTLPTEGAEALEDRTQADGIPHFKQPAPAK